MLRSQKGPRHITPKLTHAKLRPVRGLHGFTTLGRSSGVPHQFPHSRRRAPRGSRSFAQAQTPSLASVIGTHFRVYGSLAFEIGGH